MGESQTADSWSHWFPQFGHAEKPRSRTAAVQIRARLSGTQLMAWTTCSPSSSQTIGMTLPRHAVNARHDRSFPVAATPFERHDATTGDPLSEEIPCRHAGAVAAAIDGQQSVED